MRPCWAEVNARTLEDNFRLLTKLASPHAELLAIVKADAYGHGLELCAPAAVRGGACWLGVTSVEEGVRARAVCAEARILAIAGAFPGQGEMVLAYKLTPVVWDAAHFSELEPAARAVHAAPQSVAVHLEIDTGMSRQGVRAEDLPAALAHFVPESPLRLEGVMTHLFAADEADGRITRKQLARIEKVLEALAAHGVQAEWLNVGNSAALLDGQAETIGKIAARNGMKVLMRPGLALYGLTPKIEGREGHEKAGAGLKPVLEWKSRVVSVRALKPGDAVGYNSTFVATEPMRVALVAAGYGDGLARSLGNNFSLLVRGQRAPLIGRVSMDQTVIDVTEIPGVEAGDEVVLLGEQGGERITAFDHAEVADTIPWEIFTRINARVPRIAV